MPKDPPNKAKPPSERNPTETPDVTSSQILSTRDVDAPPVPPVQRPQRRSTTHGVGWYAVEDGEDLAQPVRARRGKTILIAALVTVAIGGLVGAYLGWRTREPARLAAPASLPDGAPGAALAVAPDAAPPDAAPAPEAVATLVPIPGDASPTADADAAAVVAPPEQKVSKSPAKKVSKKKAAALAKEKAKAKAKAKAKEKAKAKAKAKKKRSTRE